ncbi:MAG: biopolymer transporter ExbD [Spirochaetes bacterium]|nr:biopolymer transporter ExbD [Spirochaetota bacterium]
MKLPRKWDDEGGIIMTPLIDMVFLTLIFFMVNATLSINPAIRIDLPRARTSLGALSEEIVVSVRADGNLYIGERLVSIEDFGLELRREMARVGKRSILLQGERTISYEKLMEVMDQAKLAGVGRISLATTRKTSP